MITLRNSIKMLSNRVSLRILGFINKKEWCHILIVPITLDLGETWAGSLTWEFVHSRRTYRYSMTVLHPGGLDGVELLGYISERILICPDYISRQHNRESHLAQRSEFLRAGMSPAFSKARLIMLWLKEIWCSFEEYAKCINSKWLKTCLVKIIFTTTICVKF